MRKKWLTAFVAAGILAGPVLTYVSTPATVAAEESGTVVTEGITEDTVWTKDKSPYIVPFEVNIAPDKTLTIEPGVKVIAQSDYAMITIDGKLIANGTADEKITFEKMFLKGGTYPDGRIELTHSDLSRPRGGFILQINDNDPEVVLKHNSFSGGTVILSGNKEKPMSIESNFFSEKAALNIMNGNAPVMVKGNTFDNGDLESFTDVTLYSTSYRPSANVTFHENNFLGSGHTKVHIHGSESLTFNGDQNYWGTQDQKQVHQLINDGNDYSGISGNRIRTQNPAVRPFTNGWPAGDIAAPNVQEVTNEDDDIDGYVNPGYELQIWKSGELIVSGKPAFDGMFSLNLNIQPTVGDVLEVYAVKPISGYISKPVLVMVKQYVPLVYDVSEVTDRSESVNGRTTHNATVKLFNNGVEIGSGKADFIGKFQLSFPKQPAGSMLELVVTTPKQNINTMSILVTDKTAPLAPKVNPISNKSVSVSGVAEKGAAVTVQAGGKTYRGTADATYGKFSIPIPVQNAGASVTVTATDAAQNASPPVTVKATRVAPNVPIVNAISNKAAYVTGTAERYSTVNVQIGSKLYTSKADAYGKYKVVFPVQNTGTAVSVTAADKYGKVSLAAAVKVYRIAPNMPAVSPVRYTSVLVNGKTEPSITAYAKIGTKVYSAKSASDGTFKISIPKQTKGTKIYVTAKDAKSMISAARVVTVY